MHRLASHLAGSFSDLCTLSDYFQASPGFRLKSLHVSCESRSFFDKIAETGLSSFVDFYTFVKFLINIDPVYPEFYDLTDAQKRAIVSEAARKIREDRWVDREREPNWLPLSAYISSNPQCSIINQMSEFCVCAYGSWELCALGMYDKMGSDEQMISDKTGIAKENILMTYLRPSVAQSFAQPHLPCFYLARDPQRNCVVLSICGTSSMKDVYTDLMCFNDDIEILGSKLNVHSGMLAASRAVIDKVESILVSQMESSEKIQVVGHSLGGGAALLCGMLLAEKYPEVTFEVFAFGPPPVISEEPSIPSNLSLNSLVFDLDIVSRLSLRAAEDMVYDLKKIGHPNASDRNIVRAAPIFIPGKVIAIRLDENGKTVGEGDGKMRFLSGKKLGSLFFIYGPRSFKSHLPFNYECPFKL